MKNIFFFLFIFTRIKWNYNNNFFRETVTIVFTKIVKYYWHIIIVTITVFQTYAIENEIFKN